MAFSERNAILPHLLTLSLLAISVANQAIGIRIPDQISNPSTVPSDQPLKIAVFALGSFWRSEAIFGCVNGVVRTTAGYSGGSKSNPEYRSLGDHAESVQVQYDPRVISFRQLLEVFWSSHDSRQVFGQGPDVGNQYRSVIFTNGTEEARLAAVSKEKEQLRSRSSIVTTQIQQFVAFYPAEPEQQLMGNLPEEELERSSLAAKLNGYAAELCPPKIQNQIGAKINEIVRKGWPVLIGV
ncbi:peptide methionine sulfoxide reductase A5 isoform X2 [Hevea brasiliensis]|uniref:peptide methionine sulfoxide reductase A5 isoform X2 n=1 Tax=Hevea brasiliensis TaxID=3981 RepID=UPI000B795770|nr:peptide methionine sulfoxide reductase A5 isoform X2 [Hevea brasiliensis]